MSTPVITLTGAVRDTSITGGDVVDVGVHGVLVWLVDEDAEAYRLWMRKRQRETRSTIDHVRKTKGRRT